MCRMLKAIAVLVRNKKRSVLPDLKLGLGDMGKIKYHDILD